MAEAVAAIAMAATVATVAATAIFFYNNLKYLIPYTISAAAAGFFATATAALDPIFAVGGGLGLGFFLFPGLNAIYGTQKDNPLVSVNAVRAMKGTSMIFFGSWAGGIAHASSGNLVVASLAAAAGALFGARIGWNAAANFWIGMGFGPFKNQCLDNSDNTDFSKCVAYCATTSKADRKKMHDSCMRTYGDTDYCKKKVDHATLCPTVLRGRAVGSAPPPNPTPVPPSTDCGVYKPFAVQPEPTWEDICGQTPSSMPPNWDGGGNTTWRPMPLSPTYDGYPDKGGLGYLLGRFGLGGRDWGAAHLGTGVSAGAPALDGDWKMVNPGVVKDLKTGKYTCSYGADYNVGTGLGWYANFGPQLGASAPIRKYPYTDFPADKSKYPSGKACYPTTMVNGKKSALTQDPRDGTFITAQPVGGDRPRFCSKYDKDARKLGDFSVAHTLASANGFTCQLSIDKNKTAGGVQPWP